MKKLGVIPAVANGCMAADYIRPTGEGSVSTPVMPLRVTTFRPAGAEIHTDEMGSTAAGVPFRAASFLTEPEIQVRDVISDNTFSCRYSNHFQDSFAQFGAHQLLIRPHCPWWNGKDERLTYPG